MTIQRVFSAAILMMLVLFAAGLLFSSPYQLWGAMAAVGAITGISYKIGQRHVISGLGLGIALALVREVLTYGADVAQLTAPAYAAGYLFAVASTLALRYLRLRFTTERAAA